MKFLVSGNSNEKCNLALRLCRELGLFVEEQNSIVANGAASNNFVHIPGGTFLMGSPESEAGRYSDEAQHEVTIGDFSIGKFQVTNKEYNEYLGAIGKSLIQKPNDLPVVNVSGYDATSYCDWLTATRKDGYRYRLPTEAEWEYACRAGSTGSYCFGDDVTKLKDYAWYDENSNDQVYPVGQKLPNFYGLYDMHGNVWELCQDFYRGSSRVLRGGSWFYDSRDCRSASRLGFAPGDRCDYVGFRLSRGQA
jgi:formylglycine-generating enzyme required for sulfatase activity